MADARLGSIFFGNFNGATIGRPHINGTFTLARLVTFLAFALGAFFFAFAFAFFFTLVDFAAMTVPPFDQEHGMVAKPIAKGQRPPMESVDCPLLGCRV